MIKESTCSKLGGGDIEGLDLQSECVEGEDRHHGQRLLCVAHVGAAQCARQVVQTGVTGKEGSCGDRQRERKRDGSELSKSEPR